MMMEKIAVLSGEDKCNGCARREATMERWKEGKRNEGEPCKKAASAALVSSEEL
jgi:hypothetical protein